MKKQGVFLLLLLLTVQLLPAQGKHRFEIANGSFLYDGKPVQIHSGEMHYARVPKEYWRHRLQMIKAMGLNAVATYVFWNYHNTAPGVWDFTTDNKNIAEFIKLAQQEGLWVILRPGPYSCAEWEFGGYPWWLQQNKQLVVRANNQPFLDSCKQYIQQLAAQVKPLLVTNGGPVIMVQAENEFGSYVAQRKDIPLDEHKKYSAAILQMLKDAGMNVPLFTSDGSWLFDGGALPGVLPTANGEGNVDNLKKAVDKYHDGKGPYMVAEFYPGWLDHWAEKFTRIGTDQIATQTEAYLKNGISFNFYMVHGGTNFGFTAGANYNGDHDIQPDITSYDYDAPISEAGWVTPKYTALRELMKKYVHYQVPEVPAAIAVKALPAITLTATQDVLNWKNKLKPVVSDTVLSFESLQQGSGYVLYSKKFTQPVHGVLKVPGLRDYATVYVDGKRVGVLNRVAQNYECTVDIPFNSTLDILVENMGRINYGAQITENTKGIIAPVTIDGFAITGNWEMYKMPFDKAPVVTKTEGKNKPGRPVLYSGEFELSSTADTFFDMSKWGKGIVFINGHHLGRYWQTGPQLTLYVPGCWLQKGKNQVTVFEQLNDTLQTSLTSVTTPVLEQLQDSE